MKVLKYILLPFMALSIASCSDYLEKFPLDNPSDETFLRTEAEFDMAVTGAYNSLWHIGPVDVSGPFFPMLDAASDIGWDRNTSGLQALGMGIANVDNNWGASFWSAFYRGIGRCNFILSKADEIGKFVPEEKFKRQIAEVRFLRSYYYFLLNEAFGGVPLVTTPLTLSEAQLPRQSKEEVVNFILSELDAVVAALPASVTGANVGKVTKGVAWALKSRVALYNSRWDVAAQAANEVIQSGVYSLHPSYPELFKYAGQNSKEIILAAQYLKGYQVHSYPRFFGSRMSLGHSNKIPVQALIDSYECTDGLSIDKSPLFNVAKPFANRDPRLGYTTVLPQTRFERYIFETHPDSTLTWDFSTTPARRVQNTEATHAYATFSGYLWRKYTDDADFPDINNSDLNIILFRYAEVLLNYAEAKIEANQIDQTVYDAINAIRTRPTVNMPAIVSGKSQAELRSIVRKERKYELAGEGYRLFDIRRWKIGEEAMNGPLLGRVRNAFLTDAPYIDENGTPHYENVRNKVDMRVIEIRSFKNIRDNVWPIPRLEIEVNPLLNQNPEY